MPSGRQKSCQMTRSWPFCVEKAWTLPGGPWPNTGKRCASPARCSANGRRPCRPERGRILATTATRDAVAGGRSRTIVGEKKRMQITVSGKQVDLSDALRTRVETAARRLELCRGAVCLGLLVELEPDAQENHADRPRSPLWGRPSRTRRSPERPTGSPGGLGRRATAASRSRLADSFARTFGPCCARRTAASSVESPSARVPRRRRRRRRRPCRRLDGNRRDVDRGFLASPRRKQLLGKNGGHQAARGAGARSALAARRGSRLFPYV